MDGGVATPWAPNDDTEFSSCTGFGLLQRDRKLQLHLDLIQRRLWMRKQPCVLSCQRQIGRCGTYHCDVASHQRERPTRVKYSEQIIEGWLSHQSAGKRASASSFLGDESCNSSCARNLLNPPSGDRIRAMAVAGKMSEISHGQSHTPRTSFAFPI